MFTATGKKSFCTPPNVAHAAILLNANILSALINIWSACVDIVIDCTDIYFKTKAENSQFSYTVLHHSS